MVKIKKNKVGLCHGVFDLIHIGHLNHFKSAKSLCDHLIVSITQDKFIKKGINQPLFNENQRADFLRSIKFIDEVYICKSESASDSIKKFKPDFYIKGPDYKINKLDETRKIYLEKKLVKKYKGQIIYTNDKKYSSSKIMNSKSFGLNEKQSEFIDILKKKYSLNYIISELKKLKNVKPLVLGELIIDTYCYGNAIGKASKEPHLVLSRLKEESYIGGSGAIAKNISNFSKKVTLISESGNEKKYSRLFKEKLGKNIKSIFFKPYSTYTTIRKTRYIDNVNNYKLLGYYDLPEINKKINKTKLYKSIKFNLIKNNLLIVCDFGHNFFDQKIINLANNLKGYYKSANVQINSANFGSQSLKKYKNLDALFVNEGELRHEYKDKFSSIETLGRLLKKNNKIKNIIITRGKNGAVMIDKGNKIINIPAFANSSVDKIGAGDSLFAVSSIALSAGIDGFLSLFLGSLSAAESVRFPGNKYSINQNIIERYIGYIYR